MFRELESSEDEFYIDSFTTDFDKESDNICSENISSRDSDSGVVPVKRQFMQLNIFIDREEEETYEMRIVV